MPAARHVTHLPVLDGLRAVAVLLVLWAHVDPALYPGWLLTARYWFDPGVQGVDLFFVLSGFLITRILLAERQRGVPLRWFLLRRFLRIFPIYYLLLAILLASGYAGRDLLWCALYLSNFHYVFAGGGGPLEHTWSLCVEEHFYLLWPPVVAFCSAAWARRALWIVVPPAALATLAFVVLDLEGPQLIDGVYYLSPIRFASLGVGCLMAFGEARIAARPAAFVRLGLALLAAGVALMPGTLMRALIELGRSDIVRFEMGPIATLASAMCISTGAMLCCVAAGAGLALAPLRSRPLRAVGRISYGLYLYHLPVFHYVYRAHDGVAGLGRAVLLAFAVATVSYLVVERPILRFGARFR